MPPKKGRQPSKTREKKRKAPTAPVDVPVDAPVDAVPAPTEKNAAEDEDEDEEVARSPSPPSALEIQAEVHAPPAAAAADDAAAESGAEDNRPEPSAGKGKGKGKSKGKANPKHDYSIEAEKEESLLEWMAEHEAAWRRGHRDYKKRREIWGAKAAEIGMSVEHIMGWWKSVKDWYVRLNKVKSGQAVKKYTDREQFIIDNCKFYKTQLPSTKSAPMVNLQMTTSTQPARVSDSEPDSDQEQAPTSLDANLEVVERTSAEAAEAGHSSRPMKKRKRERGDQEEEWMKELRDTMKANQKLLAQLIQEKPAQSSEREVFIKYVSDSLRAAPAEQYEQLKTRISNLLDSASQDTAPAPQPARPAQATSAPPVFHQSQQQVPLYQQQQDPHYQQQPAPQYQQQPFQQYQHQGLQYQQYQQQQPSQYQQPQQSQSHTSSAASGEQRLSASSFNLLQTSQEVLDGSINLSAFSLDSQLLPTPSSNRPSTQSLNTPPAPQRDEKDSDSD